MQRVSLIRTKVVSAPLPAGRQAGAGRQTYHHQRKDRTRFHEEAGSIISVISRSIF